MWCWIPYGHGKSCFRGTPISAARADSVRTRIGSCCRYGNTSSYLADPSLTGPPYRGTVDLAASASPPESGCRERAPGRVSRSLYKPTARWGRPRSGPCGLATVSAKTATGLSWVAAGPVDGSGPIGRLVNTSAVALRVWGSGCRGRLEAAGVSLVSLRGQAAAVGATRLRGARVAGVRAEVVWPGDMLRRLGEVRPLGPCC